MFFFMKSFSSFAKLHRDGPQSFYRAESWWWWGVILGSWEDLDLILDLECLVSTLRPTHLDSQ